MQTFLFITNPQEYDTESIKRGKWRSWSCSKTTNAGNPVFVYLTGGIGIKHEWIASSNAKPDPKWRFRCNVKHVRNFEPPITLQELCSEFSQKEWAAPYTQFRGLKSIRVSDEVASRIRGLRGIKGLTMRSPKKIPVAAEQENEFSEGEQRAYQGSVRNPQLRVAAKRNWGLKCYCCGFDFEQFYGSGARGFAIVHHINPFVAVKGKKRKTTVQDVRVICANCHHVIHLRNPAMSTDDLKGKISIVWGPWSNFGISRKKPH